MLQEANNVGDFEDRTARFPRVRGTLPLFGIRSFACVAAGLCLLNVIRTSQDIQNYGGTDLRARVVGARALVRGMNPYTLRESENSDPALRDPDRRGLNRCTYPPTLLLAYSPLSSHRWMPVRAFWAIAEWAAFGATLVVLASGLRDPIVRRMFLCVAVGLFGGSGFWRLHAERGQYYVFAGLLISAGICLLRRSSRVSAGVFWGFAIGLRPTAMFLLVPWLTGNSRRVVVSAILTAVGFAGVSTLFSGLQPWKDFAALSKQWEQVVLGAVPEAAADDSAGGPTDGYQSAVLNGHVANLTFASLFRSVKSTFGMALSPAAAILIGRLIWGLSVFSLWLCMRSQQRRRDTTEYRLLAGSCLMLVTDCFLPIRVEYADILFLIPVALMAPVLNEPQNRGFAVLLIGALAASCLPIHTLPDTLAGPVAMFRCALVIYLLIRFTIRGEYVTGNIVPGAPPIASSGSVGVSLRIP